MQIGHINSRNNNIQTAHAYRYPEQLPDVTIILLQKILHNSLFLVSAIE